MDSEQLNGWRRNNVRGRESFIHIPVSFSFVCTSLSHTHSQSIYQYLFFLSLSRLRDLVASACAGCAAPASSLCAARRRPRATLRHRVRCVRFRSFPHARTHARQRSSHSFRRALFSLLCFCVCGPLSCSFCLIASFLACFPACLVRLASLRFSPACATSSRTPSPALPLLDTGFPRRTQWPHQRFPSLSSCSCWTLPTASRSSWRRTTARFCGSPPPCTSSSSPSGTQNACGCTLDLHLHAQKCMQHRRLAEWLLFVRMDESSR